MVQRWKGGLPSSSADQTPLDLPFSPQLLRRAGVDYVWMNDVSESLLITAWSWVPQLQSKERRILKFGTGSGK